MKVCSLPMRNVIRFSHFSKNIFAMGFDATDMEKIDSEDAVPPCVRREATNLSI